MNEDMEKRLQNALERLEKSTKKIIETRGYGKDVARLRVLVEIIKEQLQNENSGSSARAVR